MYDWIVLIMGREYRVKAENRNKAIYQAVRLYRKETGDLEIVAVIAAVASCTKIGGRKRINVQG